MTQHKQDKKHKSGHRSFQFFINFIINMNLMTYKFSKQETTKKGIKALFSVFNK